LRATEVRVGALIYALTRDSLDALWINAKGVAERFNLGRCAHWIPRLDALRKELQDPMRVATGRVPLLREFAESWGVALLPPPVHAAPLDVLVIVPHAALHGIPLHLVRGPGEEPFGTRMGITYASSMSLFMRCRARNTARDADLEQWIFDGTRAPSGHPVPWNVRGGGADVLTDEDPQFTTLCQQLAALIPGDRKVYYEDHPFDRGQALAPVRTKEKLGVLLWMAHGYLDPGNQRLSGLLLHRGQGVGARTIPLHGGWRFIFRNLPLRRFPTNTHPTGPGEILTTAELEIDAEFNAQLVVLLACSAGWGKVLQGDEPASIAETFLHLGAPSVVAPLWASSFEAARDWTRYFLSGWIEFGLPKALAARYAMKQMHSAGFQDSPEELGVMALRGDWL
jgi:CHAT domain-containing protein